MQRILDFFLFDKHGKFLDYVGGFSIFTRLTRAIGFDFSRHDLMTHNLRARGFKHGTSSVNCELLTNFESLEHFADPLNEVRNHCVCWRMKSKMQDDFLKMRKSKKP
jgi:hypothetical protein